MQIRLVKPTDTAEWLRMRTALWPESSAVHETEIQAFLNSPRTEQETFVCDRGNGQLGGFLETNIRTYAEGCDSDRVAYVEGWYVDADLRRQGVGRQLIQAAEEWARSLHLTEMASDCLIDNQVSYTAHLASGFEEVERAILFRKRLSS